MVTITYDALNDLVTTIRAEIEKTTGIPADTLDFTPLNGAIVEYLARYGVLYEDYDEDDPIFSPLRRAGVVNVIVRYNGGNDEGYIEDADFDPPLNGPIESELFNLLRDDVYEILEREHGGWEINEGSEGTVTYDVATRKKLLKHGEHVETTNWSEQEV